MPVLITATRLVPSLPSWPALAAVWIVFQATISFAFKSSPWVAELTLIPYLLLLFLAAGAATMNALRKTLSHRPFWVLMALGFGLWALDQWLWVYYRVGLGRSVPDASLGDPALFLHVVPFLAAVATRPDLGSWGRRGRQMTLNFLLILFFWTFLYAFMVFPYQFLFPESRIYNLRYDALYFIENFALVLVLAFILLRARAPWKTLYWNLLGATSIYALGSLLSNMRIDLGGYSVGDWSDLIIVISLCWYVWVPIQARRLPPAAELPDLPVRGSLQVSSLLATVAVLAIPVLGGYEILQNGNPHLLTIRTLIVLGFVTILGVIILATRYLESRELERRVLSSDASRRKSEDRFRTLVESVDAVIWEADAATLRLTFVSRGAERVLGYPQEQWVQTPDFWTDHLHPEDRSRALACEAEVLKTGQPHAVEYRLARADGQYRWFRDFTYAVKGDSGEIEYLRGILVDITENRNAQEALRISEQRYRDFISHSSDGVWRLEMGEPIPIDLPSDQALQHLLETGYMAECNEALARINGRASADMLVGRRLKDLIPPQDTDRLESIHAVIRQGWRTQTNQFETVIGDLGRRYLERTSVPIVVDGQVLRIWGSTRDVTDLKRAEAALRESEEHFRSLVENATVGIYRATPDGRIVMANSTLIKMLGYETFEDLSARNLETSGSEPSHSRREFKALLEKDGEVRGLEGTWVMRDGSVRYVRESARTVRRPDGSVEYYDGIVEDITAHKHTEHALVRLRQAVDTSGEVIFMTDHEGVITFINREFTSLYGHSEEEVVGKSTPRILKGGKQSDENYRAFWNTILHKRVARGQLVNKTRSGRLVTVDSSVNPILDARGEITGYLAIQRDVTERKNLEEQFRQAQKMEAVGRLAGGVAHDFNNLLTIINGYSQLLLDQRPETDPERDLLGQILRAGERAASLTRQLLAFSRRQMLAPQVLNLNEVVRNMQRMAHRLIREDVEVKVRLSDQLGQVKADPAQIEQVILNLLVNAADAMPQGGNLLIETANADLDESYVRDRGAAAPGRYVMLAVSDTGMGMDAATREHIFEPFFTTKEKGKGTGLGLATVYGIVKQSGGEIWAYSQPGKGSTFKVYLPRVEGEAESAESKEPAPSPGGTETVLLVEDEKSVRTLAARILLSRGYRVLESKDVEDAVRIGESYSQSIELLLTDVVMPGMSGRNVADRLRFVRPQMKVLYISGYTDDAIVHHRVLDAGMAFLQKPFTPESLARKVREVLDTPAPPDPPKRERR